MINLKECIEKGLIRKMPASKQKALQSIEKAKELLGEAKQNLEDDRINSSVIVCYLAIFHAARAVLFRDGFREKSHECIIKYLEEKYSETIPQKQIQLLDKFKSERTHTQYDVSYSPNEEEAEKMNQFAEEFISTIEQIL
ncbi:MAG: HEPN domain-containing protein [Candidatus Diapherotrites archaeon]|nr:HEPN domain-containing protein [Candidatus Diapherotrites archaeon]